MVDVEVGKTRNITRRAMYSAQNSIFSSEAETVQRGEKEDLYAALDDVKKTKSRAN